MAVVKRKVVEKKKTTKERSPEIVKVSLVTPPCIAGYCHLDKPDEFMGKEFYKVAALLPKDTTFEYAEQIDDFVQKVFDLYEAVEAKHRSVHPCPLKDGDKMDYDNLRGHWVLNAKSAYPIEVVNGKKVPILPKKIWGGDLIRAGVDFKEMSGNGFTPSLSAYALFVQLLQKRTKSKADLMLSGLDEWESDEEEEEQEEYDENPADEIPF